MVDLTDRQQLFIEHYLVCLNGAEAARRAGYAARGARQEAHRLLTNADIRAAIDARMAEYVMPANEVLARLTDTARGSMADFLTIGPRGTRIDLRRAAEADKLHLVKKYSKTKQGESIELYDAHTAKELLGKYHKLWTDKVEHSGDVGRPARVVKVYRSPKATDQGMEPDGA
jgi:phage terminase small subunit